MMVNEVMLKEWYDDMLDECYPEVEIMGIKYSPSVALFRIDPIAYQVGMNDYESTLRADFEYDHDDTLQKLFEDEEE
tara:strand:- start:571 stop:801 length:231 start_codon:yes stop_codon:yes gene_type:complete